MATSNAPHLLKLGGDAPIFHWREKAATRHLDHLLRASHCWRSANGSNWRVYALALSLGDTPLPDSFVGNFRTAGTIRIAQ